MIVIDYRPDGDPVSDFEAEAVLHVLSQAQDDVMWPVCTTSPILAAKCLVEEGYLEHDEVLVRRHGIDYPIEQYAIRMDRFSPLVELNERQARASYMNNGRYL